MPVLAKKRVMIVDDAVVVRRLLSDAISADSGLEVAGTASNGRLALMKFASLRPDIVLLDIEMPEMDGLETVRQMRKMGTRVPIIMFSTLTEHAATATLEALSLGATDYVTKPSNTDIGGTLHAVSEELIPKIRALCGLPDNSHGKQEPVPFPILRRMPPHTHAYLPIHVVAIGVSTGGPDALAKLLPGLPAQLSVPMIIAQHMPPVFTAMLAARLSAKSPLPVHECKSGEPLLAGCAVLAPGDFHMVVDSKDGIAHLRTNQGPKENFCRPSVDTLFRSVAQLFGDRALGIVLTGMGQDGLKGCEVLQNAGGRVIVQDEASSVVWGMPGLVARAGLADKVLPLDQIAAEIVRAANGKWQDGAQAYAAKINV
ncbi:MAG TPA: chemotaxis response regulator protein-glutamate methylesterase [Candidatus Sulfotelmatobacter sp.]